MPFSRSSARVTRYAAPAAFLAAATVAVLLVRNGLERGERRDDATAVTKTTARPASAPRGNRPAPSRPARNRRYYRVREGETLEQVAARFDTSVRRILALNPGIDPTSLRIGQRVRVA